MTAPVILIGVACALSAAMACAWRIQRASRNSGWIDTIWSLSVGAVAACALLASGPLEGRRLLALALVAIWSARLGLHIARRSAGAGDDPRYAALIASWGAGAPRRLFTFLQYQAVAGFVLVGAVLLAAAKPDWSWTDSAATFLAACAVVGEGVADAQLAAFKARAPRPPVLDSGLWGLSRHPNYFFEWLFWVAVACLAIDWSGAWAWGWLALAAPAMMYALLAHASGIPHVEAHMRRTRPDAFADYARRVPAFFPRLPKRR